MERVFQELAASISALPNALSSAVAQLPPLLSTLGTALEPVSASLQTAQRQQLLSNATWLAANLDQLDTVLSTIPGSDIEASSREDLLAAVEIGSTRYDIMTLWAPEVWSIFVMYLIALACKAMTMLMLHRKAVFRVRSRALEDGHAIVSFDTAKATLAKPCKAMIGHSLNLVISTIVLVFQLLAWRLFVLPSQPIRAQDVRNLSVAMKTLTIGYAADLLFGDVNWEIFLHHVFTYGLLLAGQICVFKTNSPKFFRMANWLILQATLEQSTYFAMACYHASTYLKTQAHKSNVQRILLKLSWMSLTFTKFITYQQKLVPAGMAFYWLARMWNDIDTSADGRFWLGWATSLIVTLCLLQVKFCDDVWPICDHVYHKLHGGKPGSRVGPVMRILLRPFGLRSGGRRVSQGQNPTQGESKAEQGARSTPQRPPISSQGTLPIAFQMTAAHKRPSIATMMTQSTSLGSSKAGSADSFLGTSYEKRERSRDVIEMDSGMGTLTGSSEASSLKKLQLDPDVTNGGIGLVELVSSPSEMTVVSSAPSIHIDTHVQLSDELSTPVAIVTPSPTERVDFDNRSFITVESSYSTVADGLADDPERASEIAASSVSAAPRASTDSARA